MQDIVARTRGRVASAVLGTTAPDTDEGPPDGLSLGQRLLIAAASIGIATLFAFTARAQAGAFAAIFFFPGLMVAALFGGIELGLAALAAAVAVSAYAFTQASGTIFFAAVAALQTALALVLRQRYRESRRWSMRYGKLVSAISAATTVHDAQGRIDRPHPELARLIGMPWPEHGGTRWLDAIHPDDRALLPPMPTHHDVEIHHAEIRLRDSETGDWRWYLLRAVPLRGKDGDVAEWVSILTDIHDRKLSEEQRDLAFGEMRHRFKNLMTLIQAMAKSSQPRGDQAIEAYLERFFGRLHALSAAADEVLINDRIAIETGAVIRATLAPFMEENSERISIDGPTCYLSEPTGGALAMGIHELATNAIKYGALSVPTGTVRVSWNCCSIAEGSQMVIDWIEQGGPPATKPSKEGYGSRLIRFIPAHERSGSVDLDYSPEGLRCRVSFVHTELDYRPAEAE